MIPLTAPFDEILRKVKPLGPIVVALTLSAVPVVLMMVLVAPVIVTVPPPVALKPVLPPELIDTPEKLNVALGLPTRSAPLPPDVVKPSKLNVPAMLEKLTPVPVLVVTATSLTLTPVIAATGSVIPVLVVDEILSPRTVLFVLIVTVF